jgi:hypothetical protein
VASKDLEKFLARQAKDSVELYRAGKLWIAVDNADLLRSRNYTIQPVSAKHKTADAFVSLHSGYREIWCSPDYDNHRRAMVDFVRAFDEHITEQDIDSKRWVSDHAFHRKAAFDLAERNKKPLGFVRMTLIEWSANSSYGSGREKRQNHRIYTQNDHCEGNLIDVLKAANFNPSGMCPNPYALMAGGVEFLVEKGLVEEKEKDAFFNDGVRVCNADDQETDEAYAAEIGQHPLRNKPAAP